MAKKIKRRKRKTKKSSRSQPPDTATEKRPKWILILAAFICVGIAGLFWMKYLSGPDEKPRKTEPRFDSITRLDSPGPTEEEKITALKTEQMQLAQQLFRDFPGNDATVALVGSVYEQHGNNIEAVKFFHKALELNPNRADVYSALSWIAFMKEEYEDAITLRRRALEIDANLPGLRSAIASAMMMVGRQTEAIEQLEKNIQFFPNSVYSHFLLGQAYLQQKDYENAKKHYLRAIELDKNYVNAYYGLFTACSRLKQQDEASEYQAIFKKLKAEERKGLKDRKVAFDDATEMQKAVAETYMHAGKIYQDQGNPDKAQDLMERAVALDQKNTLYLMELGSSYGMSNRMTEALEVHKKISEIEPQNPVCFLNIGVISAQLKRFEDAEEALLTVIKLAPKESSGYRLLAQLYLETQRNLPKTRELAEKAVAFEATAFNYFLLGWACDVNGDTANAFSALKRAVELDPKNPKYQQMLRYIKEKELIK
jgi:tetratricopeptide (TPR) repeat protein